MALMPFDAILSKSPAALTGSNSLPDSSGRNVPYVTPQIRIFSSPKNRNRPQARGRLQVDGPEAVIGTGWLSFSVGSTRCSPCTHLQRRLSNQTSPRFLKKLRLLDRNYL